MLTRGMIRVLNRALFGIIVIGGLLMLAVAR
jgi:hypothetical protein